MNRLPRTRRLAAALTFYAYNHCVCNIPFYAIRHLYLTSILGYSLGRGASVHAGCFVTGRNIAIGKNSVVNRKCYLDGRGALVIGDNVSIAPECYILTMTHDVQSRDFAAVSKTTRIDEYAWLGARALVLPGLHLGVGCVVGAGAVVTKDVAPYAIVAGSPARAVGERNHDLSYSPRYWPLLDTDI